MIQTLDNFVKRLITSVHLAGNQLHLCLSANRKVPPGVIPGIGGRASAMSVPVDNKVRYPGKDLYLPFSYAFCFLNARETHLIEAMTL